MNVCNHTVFSQAVEAMLRAHVTGALGGWTGQRRFAVTQRRLEAALDPDGLSTTAHVVLARI